MTSDIDGVQQVITNTFTSILSNVITLVIALIAMFQKNWILALIGIVVVPLFTLPTRKAGKTRWKYANESQACNDEINGILSRPLLASLYKWLDGMDGEFRALLTFDEISNAVGKWGCLKEKSGEDTHAAYWTDGEDYVTVTFRNRDGYWGVTSGRFCFRTSGMSFSWGYSSLYSWIVWNDYIPRGRGE